MMLRRWILSLVLFVAGFAYADWAADRDASAGYVTVTTLATAIDEAVPFVVVYLSDMPADFWTAMDAASDTDGKTIRVSTSDGTTQLACVPIGVNTSTDTGCLIFLGTGMSASVDVDYRIYLGNASLSMPSASGGMGEQAVFAAYAGVYFPGVDTRDWTSGGRTLTAVNSPGTAASGYEGITAATYNGTSQYHYATSYTSSAPIPVTIEALLYCSSAPALGVTIVSLTNAGSDVADRALLNVRGDLSGDPIATAYLGTGGSVSVATTSTGTSATTWHYGSVTRDSTGAGTSTAYIDGGSAGTNTTSLNSYTSITRLGIGGRIDATPDQLFSGRVAVVLLDDTNHTANYVSTMQDNWAGTMYSTGAWTALSVAPGSTGWVLFQTAATTSASGTLVDWTSTSNALVDDATYTTAALDASGNYESETLKLTNPAYGTTVPTTAPSYLVEFRIKRERTSGTGDEVQDLNVQFIDDTGALVGTNVGDLSTNWPTTAASVDYTATGLTLDGTEFTSAAGLAISVTGTNANGTVDARVLTAWIRVSWTGTNSAANARGFFALTE